jgi:hypothetical protein
MEGTLRHLSLFGCYPLPGCFELQRNLTALQLDFVDNIPALPEIARLPHLCKLILCPTFDRGPPLHVHDIHSMRAKGIRLCKSLKYLRAQSTMKNISEVIRMMKDSVLEQLIDLGRSPFDSTREVDHIFPLFIGDTLSNTPQETSYQQHNSSNPVVLGHRTLTPPARPYSPYSKCARGGER